MARSLRERVLGPSDYEIPSSFAADARSRSERATLPAVNPLQFPHVAGPIPLFGEGIGLLDLPRMEQGGRSAGGQGLAGVRPFMQRFGRGGTRRGCPRRAEGMEATNF